uniref:Uncharacterized protein n=1 Tax=Quercus lobata TaxID=97700 RepID=A0A7N2M817_QUELO
MAVSSAMQSILVRPTLNRVVSNRSTNRVNQFLIPTSYVPHLPRYTSMRVRCMAEEDQQEQPKPVTTSPSPPQPQQTPRPAPKVYLPLTQKILLSLFF